MHWFYYNYCSWVEWMNDELNFPVLFFLFLEHEMWNYSLLLFNNKTHTRRNQSEWWRIILADKIDEGKKGDISAHFKSISISIRWRDHAHDSMYHQSTCTSRHVEGIEKLLVAFTSKSSSSTRLSQWHKNENKSNWLFITIFWLEIGKLLTSLLWSVGNSSKSRSNSSMAKIYFHFLSSEYFFKTSSWCLSLLVEEEAVG